jgi:hypothetical protein
MPVGCVKTTLLEFIQGLMDDVAMWIREGVENFKLGFLIGGRVRPVKRKQLRPLKGFSIRFQSLKQIAELSIQLTVV